MEQHSPRISPLHKGTVLFLRGTYAQKAIDVYKTFSSYNHKLSFASFLTRFIHERWSLVVFTHYIVQLVVLATWMFRYQFYSLQDVPIPVVFATRCSATSCIRYQMCHTPVGPCLILIYHFFCFQLSSYHAAGLLPIVPMPVSCYQMSNLATTRCPAISCCHQFSHYQVSCYQLSRCQLCCNQLGHYQTSRYQEVTTSWSQPLPAVSLFVVPQSFEMLRNVLIINCRVS